MKKTILFPLLLIYGQIFCQGKCDYCRQVLLNGTFATLNTKEEYRQDLKGFLLNSEYSEFKKSKGTDIGAFYEGIGFDFGMNEGEFNIKKETLFSQNQSKILSTKAFAEKWGDKEVLSKWGTCISGCDKSGISTQYNNTKETFTIMLSFTPKQNLAVPIIKKVYSTNAKLLYMPDSNKLSEGTAVFQFKKVNIENGCNVVISLRYADDIQFFFDPFRSIIDLSGKWMRTTNVVGKLEFYNVVQDAANPSYFRFTITNDPKVTLNYGKDIVMMHTGNGRIINDSTAEAIINRNYQIQQGGQWLPCTIQLKSMWKIKDLYTIDEKIMPIKNEEQQCDVTRQQIIESESRLMFRQ